MTDLSLDVEFATAALTPEERLEDMQAVLDARISHMLDALESLPTEKRWALAGEIDSLIDCRQQVVLRRTLNPDIPVEHRLELIEKGVIAQASYQSLERSLEVLRGDMHKALFATELALRFNDSREAVELRQNAAREFLICMSIDTDLMPDPETIDKGVKQILEDVRRAVSACDA